MAGRARDVHLHRLAVRDGTAARQHRWQGGQRILQQRVLLLLQLLGGSGGGGIGGGGSAR